MQVNQIEIDNSLIENALLLFTQQQIKSQQNSVQKIMNDFYNLPISELETMEKKSIYQGKVLSLDDMEKTIEYEAGLHQ